MPRAKKAATAAPVTKQRVTKAANTNIPTEINLKPSTKRMPMGQISLPSLATRMGEIYEEARRELRFPNSLKLYKQMMLDPNIATATGLIEMLISKVKWDVYVSDSASEEEKRRKKMLKWNLLSMERPWEDYISEIISYVTYGFCPLEKVYTRYESPYGRFIGIYDMPTISQDTVGKWIFDRTTGKLVGLKQDTKLIDTDLRPADKLTKTEEIPRKKFILFRHNVKRNNPEGTSPLRSCYIPWKMRNLVEEYETIGTAKDLGGTPVVGIDVSYLARAAADPTSDEATLVSEFQRQAAAMHAGEQTYVVEPLAYDEHGNKMFSFNLIGVDGGGKQYDTDSIVKRHSTSILMAFFADVLKLGSESHGSFALADSKTNILSMAIESHLLNIQKELNHDLMRQLYELNDWDYDPETACRFTFGDIEKQSLDEVGKFIQRVFSVGAMRPSEKVEDELRKIAFDLDGFAESGDTEIQTKSTSRAGDGMATPFNGTATSTTAIDASTANMNNA